jgi:putative addiction module CopG family antidote
MAFALARENEQFIARMLRRGRFNNQSEVVREALRRMEREETTHLSPPPLTAAEAERAFERDSDGETQEHAFAAAALAAVRRSRRGR